MSLSVGLVVGTRLRHGRTLSIEHSMDAAADWLARAHEATPDDGVAAFYDIKSKQWAASYPETTGYIIPTLYHYAAYRGRGIFAERATRMAVWESDIQLASGAVRAGPMNATPGVPTIFNTGQVLFGWAAAYEQTGDARFAHSLRAAADWLVSVQDDDGAWRRFASPYVDSRINTYNTRVAYGLSRVTQVLGEPRYAQAARRNVDWALTQVQPNGWLAQNDLEDNARPLTHTIAYAIRGILEVGAFADDQALIDRAGMIARAVANTQRSDGALPGRLDCRWRSAARWSCLTGNVQMAANWIRLAALTGDRGFLIHAERAIAFTRSRQTSEGGDINRRGGIPGSAPIRGGYMRYRYPNWAANFLLTAMMLFDQPELVF